MLHVEKFAQLSLTTLTSTLCDLCSQKGNPVLPSRCFWQEFVLMVLIACGYLPLLKDWVKGGQKEIPYRLVVIYASKKL